MLTVNDWNVIEEYVKVSRPIARALDKLQAETKGSQGFTIPTLIAMRHHVSSQTGRQVTEDFKRAMLKVIDDRFDEYLKVNPASRELVLATISLPRFKANHFELETDQRLARDYLIAECDRLSDETISISECSEPVNGEEDDFFVSFNTRPSRRSSVENQIETEVLRYLTDERKNNEILDEYPLIRNVHFRHNTTLSASAVVERLFSQSLMIFAPRRNRISSENFEKTLLLKHNRTLIDTD